MHYRCSLEMCKSSKEDGSLTTQDIVNSVPGKFAIICYSEIPINEQILKAAGIYL